MKKLISLALTLAILATLTIGASAAYIVGERSGTAGKYSDGAEDLKTLNESASKIDIVVSTTDVNHRYSVDIVYQDMNLAISGTIMEWDVNAMYYVPVDSGDDNDMKDITRTITVTNYSDMPVKVVPSINRVVDGTDYTADGISIKTNIDESNNVIDKATAGTYNSDSSKAVPGEAKSKTYNVSITAPGGWANVAGYYGSRLTPGTALKIGSISMTIIEG